MAEESITEALRAQDEHGLIREQTITPEAAVKHAPSQAPEAVAEKTEGKYSELLTKIVPKKSATPTDDGQPADEAVIKLDARHIGALTDEESKVQKLLDLAGTKGVVHAVRVARSLKDYYALDQMHDALANKLYQGLVERGLIEKE